MKQLFLHQPQWKHRFSHGGSLRSVRAGRGARPLSSKEFIHLVFKAERQRIHGGFRKPQSFALIHRLLGKYKAKFFIQVDQISIQGDHLHLLIRTSRRSSYQSFFRVFSGQIAQQFEKKGLISVAPKTLKTKMVTDTPTDRPFGRSNDREIKMKLSSRSKLWKHRPFTRVIRGWKSYQIVRDYIQLNEQEAGGRIPYRKSRLRGLSSTDWEILWT